ncbi:NADP-dependent oxidoreductase [Gryllotalpicola protaetiae]|uniref:NADP-dependent oxidoreductase n=1 Tax=Gryllotalpicola protaetiae TaxID=2419771 RepID=A0A387C0D6_9MICO|nr:NADP-dependent oxidoreductase [Gryllotalpicola protaetiae]AYG04011.1 NADP-dependent oxidoreductase [Gryllotalpicola protaetiae]
MTDLMTAAVLERFGGPEELKLAKIARPTRINDEILVEIHAASVNPLDAKTRAGRGVAAALDRLPAVLGHDFSGVVVESPYAAHPLQPGDAVYGFIPVPHYSGSYAQYASVPSLCVAPKPVGLSHTEAAAVPLAALTAWGVVTTIAKAHERQRILIHAGAGGVGHFAVQFAAYFGAHVIATASTRNLEWLRSLGARETIDHTAHRFEDGLEDVDVVIDLVGNDVHNTGTRSLGVLRRNGLVINVPSGSWPTLEEEATAAGVRATAYRVAPDAATLAVISRLLEQGSVRPHVDEIFPLEDVASAHARIEAGHVRGKLAITTERSS